MSRPGRLPRLWIAALVALPVVLVAIAALLVSITWRTLAPASDQAWVQRVRVSVAGRVFERTAGMAVLARLATHPLAARLVDGRSWTTTQGRWLLHARGNGTLEARCAPCAFALPALGPVPLAVDRAVLVVAAEGADRYRGTLTLGAARTITLSGHARFDRAGRVAIDASMPPTRLADVVHTLGRDLPERETVRVQGTLALRIAAATQPGPWRIAPSVEGFEVAGLDSERFANLHRPAACRVDARADLPTISGWLPRAVIAAEDARFFEHPGYDIQAMTDALAHNQRPGVRVAGASTLTQQLAKMLVAGDERSATRKLRELLYAVEMERTLGKARILQLYLALAPWGEGVCGAERAAWVHLGQRNVSAVGPVAAAWLASLLPAPNLILAGERAAGEVDQPRVARVLDAMRPMSAARREKARIALLFWAPPALVRRMPQPRETLPPTQPVATAQADSGTSPVAPPP